MNTDSKWYLPKITRRKYSCVAQDATVRLNQDSKFCERILMVTSVLKFCVFAALTLLLAFPAGSVLATSDQLANGAAVAADIIEPPGRLANVKVVLPEYDVDAYPIDEPDLSFKQEGGKYISVESNSIYRFAPGKGCLRVRYRSNYNMRDPFFEFEKCGYSLQVGKLLEIRLGGFFATMDETFSKTDLGIVPHVDVAAASAIVKKAPLVFFQKQKENFTKPFLYIFPEGRYELRYGGVAVVSALPPKFVEVKPGEVSSIDLTPPELRATVYIYGNEAASFPAPTLDGHKSACQSFVALVLRNIKDYDSDSPQNPGEICSQKRSFSRPWFKGDNVDRYTNVADWEKLPEGEYHANFKVFPLTELDPDYRYEVIVSGFEFHVIQTEANQLTEYGYYNANFGKIDGVFDGEYELFYTDDAGELKQLPFWRKQLGQKRAYRLEGVFKTERTIALPLNRGYLLKPYLYESGGSVVPQPEYPFTL